MAKKKDRSRFSIKFNENDPAHETVICLLEKQGPHSKASFIVNAVLHYINCPETPDIPLAPMADKSLIEAVVMEILTQQGITQSAPLQKVHTGVEEQEYAKAKAIEHTRKDAAEHTGPERQEKEPTPTESGGYRNNMVDNRMRDLIANTMSAFRNE